LQCIDLKRNIYNTIPRRVSKLWWWQCMACTLPASFSPCHRLQTSRWLSCGWRRLLSDRVSQWKNIPQ